MDVSQDSQAVNLSLSLRSAPAQKKPGSDAMTITERTLGSDSREVRTCSMSEISSADRALRLDGLLNLHRARCPESKVSRMNRLWPEDEKARVKRILGV